MATLLQELKNMNIKRITSVLTSVILISTALVSQSKPKLVVGITIDQMKQEYIYRFWDRFGEEGFKKIINNGHMYVDAHYSTSQLILRLGMQVSTREQLHQYMAS